MSESKVEPLVAFIRRGVKIFKLLLLRHGIPFLVTLLVPEDVVEFCEEIDDHIHKGHDEQKPVPIPVSRSVTYRIGDFSTIHHQVNKNLLLFWYTFDAIIPPA